MAAIAKGIGGGGDRAGFKEHGGQQEPKEAGAAQDSSVRSGPAAIGSGGRQRPDNGIQQANDCRRTIDAECPAMADESSGQQQREARPSSASGDAAASHDAQQQQQRSNKQEAGSARETQRGETANGRPARDDNAGNGDDAARARRWQERRQASVARRWSGSGAMTTVARLRRRRGEQRDGVVGPIAPRRGVRIDERRRRDGGPNGLRLKRDSKGEIRGIELYITIGRDFTLPSLARYGSDLSSSLARGGPIRKLN
ncbi:hypothetical protein Scep_030370 [Stephania cephalantha]|uniref:Uncharacterized protein n=1 Tax=Stephania cephalantha TaxID=152367 RepID=A0AAP0DZG6_9MAGN